MSRYGIDRSPLYTTRKPGIYPHWQDWLIPVFMAAFFLACAGLVVLAILRVYSGVSLP